MYQQICQQSKSNICGVADDNNARDIKYEGLIEKAHQLNKPLVFSSNTWYNNLEPLKWDNFITIVPFFEGYEYNNNGNILPIITCSISVKTRTKEPFLDILNYINIQEILNNVIASYLFTFKVSITECAHHYFLTLGGSNKIEDNSNE